MAVQQSLGRHHLAGGDDGVRPQDGDAPLGGVLGGFRRRANLNDYSGPITKEGVFEDLVHQRAIEFFVEGERFYDLRRWGLLEQTLKTCDDTRYKNYQTGKSGNINKFNYFPIPAKELDTNPLCTPSEGW